MPNTPNGPSDCERIHRMPEFRALLIAKSRFIVPATIFFITYYFALPALVGWVPKIMIRPVLGPVNLAYLFALSQFLVAWAIALGYVAVANKWDEQVKRIFEKLRSSQ